ncbi:MAG: hypothetical protein ACI4KM_10215 [Oscillospiraceae bacterium]
MDNIAEQLVAKQPTNGDRAKLALISIGGIFLASVVMFFAIITGFMVLVLVAVGLIAGTVYYISGAYVEYEYIITNDEMDIDKIIGKRKRKRMITIDLSGAEAFAPYPSEQDIKADATVFASSGGEKDAYYLVASHSSYGKVKVIFNPNERIRESIMQELPNTLKIKLKHNLQ